MAEPSLDLRARRNGDAPTVTGAGLEIRAEWEWLLRGPARQVADIHAALPDVSDLLAAGVLLINFGNAVGLIDLPHLGRVNVVSGKWDTSHYQQMLSELTAIAAGLPFSANSATALPYDRSVTPREDVLYHMFVYLRHILSAQAAPEEQLMPALRQILHNPHQRFTTSRRKMPLPAAQHIDATTLLQIAAGVGGLSAAPRPGRGQLPLAQALGGRLPDQIDERRVSHSVDTPENRFVKLMLDTIHAVIERMRATLHTGSKPAAFTRRLLQDCDHMQRMLLPVRQHSLWSQVGNLQQIPTASTILQGRRGYREVYRHSIRLRLATQLPLNPNEVRDLLEAKDIALLYEIWSYFTVVQTLSAILGRPAAASRATNTAYETQVSWRFQVGWSNGVQLLYNPTFARSKPAANRSYSVPLRPDIALEVPAQAGKQLHLLDAKFKVEHLETLLPPENSAGDDDTDAANERRGIFKRGDIYKMHTYRDAIPAAQSVWILYPGSETRFFPTDGPLVTWHAEHTLPVDLMGVGAVALVPGSTPQPALHAILTAIMSQEETASRNG